MLLAGAQALVLAERRTMFACRRSPARPLTQPGLPVHQSGVHPSPLALCQGIAVTFNHEALIRVFDNERGEHRNTWPVDGRRPESREQAART